MSSFFDYVKAAFLHPVNAMGAGFVGLIALVTFNPVFFLLLVGWEVAWVGGAPMVPAFRSSVDNAKALKARASQSKDESRTLAAFSPDVQQRYKKLQSVAVSIRINFEKGTSPSSGFLDQISTRVDELLQRYLELLKARDVYRSHASDNAPDELQAKLTELDSEIASADDALAEIKIRQRGILQQRLEQALKAEKDHRLLQAQLDTIEELVQLLNTQAVTISKPEEISRQLDSIMTEIDVTEATMHELQSSLDVQFDAELEKSIQQKRLDS